MFTVFPFDVDRMPQDFSSYLEAREYGDSEFGLGGYIVAATAGGCV